MSLIAPVTIGPSVWPRLKAMVTTPIAFGQASGG